MATKSSLRIESEMFAALTKYFDGLISGTLYRGGCRPFDSKAEDAVLLVRTTGSKQIQRGDARINIFVPSIDNGVGRPVPDIDRMEVIADWAEEIVDVLNQADTDYEFSLSEACGSTDLPDIEQHFVCIHLKFKLITF